MGPQKKASLGYWLLLLVTGVAKCSLQICAMGNPITVTGAMPVSKRPSVPITNMWFSRSDTCSQMASPLTTHTVEACSQATSLI